MGSLFTTGINGTTPAGSEITGITSGSVFLDFVAGTVTLPEGSTAPLTRTMTKNLNDLGLNQCNSIGVWCSDADATIHVGSAISLSDHQLSHVIRNYGFSNCRIEIPANSEPDETNQIFFMASTDGWMGYSFPNISHQRGRLPVTGSNASTDSSVVYLSKHVGAYNQFMITTNNSDGSNSLDLRIQYSEDGSNWFNDDGYSSSAVTITAGNYDTWASEIAHHFYRVVIVSTSAGNSADFELYYNFVKQSGSTSN